MSNSKKGAGPHAGNNKSKRVERMFHKMASRLEKAGDACRVQGGGGACSVFTVTAWVLRQAPAFIAAVEAESLADGEMGTEQASPEPSSGVEAAAAAAGGEAKLTKPNPDSIGDAAIKSVEEKAGEVVATAEASDVRR